MKKQVGSAHLVLVVVLVVALLGALGFIFWQNYANKPSNNTAVVSKNENPQPVPLLKFATWNTEFLKDESSVKGSMYEGYDFEFAAVYSGNSYKIYSKACNGQQLGTLSRSENKQADTIVTFEKMNYNFKQLIKECSGANESASGKDANVQLNTAVMVFKDSLKTIHSAKSENEM